MNFLFLQELLQSVSSSKYKVNRIRQSFKLNKAMTKKIGIQHGQDKQERSNIKTLVIVFSVMFLMLAFMAYAFLKM